MGRVARMPGTGLPKGKRKKRKIRESGRRFRASLSRKRVIATWTVLIGGITLACLGIAVWLGINFKPAEEMSAVAQPMTVTLEPAPSAEPKIPSLTEDEALSLVKKALAVRDPSRISEFFREGDVPAPGEVEFLRKLEVLDGRIDHFEWLGNLDANGLRIDGVLIEFQSDGKPRNRIAELTPDAQGKWKIDFDAFARTVTPAWSDLIGGRTEVAKVRVYVAGDSYYNGPFRNEDDWLCVSFVSPDTEEILTGYCKTGSPQSAAMKWLLKKDSNMSRAVLEIRRVEAAEPRQVVISKVLAEDWVIGDRPFDERFK